MHLLTFTHDILELLQTEHAQSPEELLTALEDALENGEITIDEIMEIINENRVQR